MKKGRFKAESGPTFVLTHERLGVFEECCKEDRGEKSDGPVCRANKSFDAK